MKSNTEWKEWGKHDPLFAVATWKGKNKDGPDPWTDTAFYNLGMMDWAEFKQHWSSYTVLTGHCVEIGCGAGRMTKQLAAHFEKVTALDVSAEQIEYAQRQIQLTNVSFLLTDGLSMPLEEDSVNAVFSCHVFQHFDTKADTKKLFREIYKKLTTQGTFCIHLPIFSLPSNRATSLIRRYYAFCDKIRALKAGYNRSRQRLVMRFQYYEKEWLTETLNEIGFTKIEIKGFSLSSNGAWHEIILATK